MASDKVHPMEEGWHAARLPSALPAFVSSSSAAAAAPRPTTNSASIQMPEKMIHKEQEQSLIPNRPNDQIRQKDYIYSTPVPLPPNHPSHRANRRRRCSRCCCCIASFCATLATIIVLLGIAALLIYFVLKPKAPNFSVTKATVSKFAISASNATSTSSTSSSSSSTDAVLSLNASVIFTVQAENPNKKIGIYYDEVDVTLYYSDEEIGTGSIPAFYQGHRNTTLLDVEMTGQNISLTPSIGSTLQSSLKNDNSSIWLEAKAIAHVRIKVGSWKSKDAKVQVDCNVEISNPTDTDVRLLSKTCKFKLKSLKLF